MLSICNYLNKRFKEIGDKQQIEEHLIDNFLILIL